MGKKIYQPGESYDYQLTVNQILKTGIKVAPDQEIVYRDKFRYTYRDLYERVHMLADALTGLGVKKGDKVAVFDFDSHRYLECFFAIPMMGAVILTMNFRLSPEQIVYILNHAGAKVIIVNSELVPIVAAIKDKISTLKKIVIIREDTLQSELPVKADSWYDEMLENASPDYDFEDIDENTAASLFYTTGTTGMPKGVHFTHRQLFLHVVGVMTTLGAYQTNGRLRSNDVYMPLTPMFHVHAWGVPYVATILGVKQVYPGKYEPAMLMKLLANEKVTFSHCVPTVIQMLVNNPAAKMFDLSKWKVVIGGSRLPKGLAKAAMDLGIDIYAAYGMSEACPMISISHLKENMLGWDADRQLDYRIKAGIPGFMVDVEIHDQNGKHIAKGNGDQTGEVVFRTPWLTHSYYNEPEKTKELWKEGWLHSGDVGYLDCDGYLNITDRLKDVIKTGGEWVASTDLENLLSQHVAVVESAAIGIPDSKWGERPYMAVTIKPEYRDKVTPESLKQFMIEASKGGTIPKYGIPDLFEFWDEIPKTSVGKLDKKKIRSIVKDKMMKIAV